ncbi:MAG: hypothetical protein DIU66_006865 [Bacillota bacterium]
MEGRIMNTISGRIGGPIGGYSLECRVDDTGIYGRLGGPIIGADINLKKDQEGRLLEGRIGGAVFGKDLRMEVGGDYARGRLNGKITGRCGGVFDGFDVDLIFLAGRFGSSIFEMRCLIFIAPF